MSLSKRKNRKRSTASSNPSARGRVVKKSENFDERVKQHKPKTPVLENRIPL